MRSHGSSEATNITQLNKTMNNRQEEIESGKRMQEAIDRNRKSEAEKKIEANKNAFRKAITDPNSLTSADIARLTPEQIKQFYKRLSEG